MRSKKDRYCGSPSPGQGKRLPGMDEGGKLKGLVSIYELAPCLNKEAVEISALFWK